MTDDEAGTSGDGRPGGDEVGSLGEEAAKLFGALSEWARDHGRAPGAGGPFPGAPGEGGPAADLAGFASRAARAARDLDAHIATDDPECRWCPVCRTIHLVRECTPEVRDQLGVAAAHLMQAAAGLLVSASQGGRRERGSSEHVQHIDLEDDTDGAEGPGGAEETGGAGGTGGTGGTGPQTPPGGGAR